MLLDSLKCKILNLAIQGKLLPQNKEDEPAAALIDKIYNERGNIHNSSIFKRSNHYYEVIDGEEQCIDDEIMFEIPESWKWVRLGSLVTVLGGKRIPAGRKLTQNDTGHIYIRVSDMKEHSVKLESLLFVPEDIYPTISKYVIKKEDIYITVAGTIGVVGKIPAQLDGANLTENADRLVFQGIHQDWLIRFLSSSFGQSQIANSTTKVGQPKLAIKRIEKFLIAVPPFSEQERISNEIDLIFNQIDIIEKKRNSLAENTVVLEDKVIRLAIQGKLIPQNSNDEPASVLMNKIIAEGTAGSRKREKMASFIFKGEDEKYYEKRGSIIKNIDNEIPFKIPDSWIWARIGSAYEVTMGQSPKGGSITSDDDGIEFHQGKIYFGDQYLLPSNKKTTKATKVIDKESVLLCVRAPVGEVNIVDRRICIGRGLCAISSSFCSIKFLYYVLRVLKNEFARHATGSTFSEISNEIVKNQLVPLPPFAEQERIVSRIEKYESMIQGLKNINQ